MNESQTRIDKIDPKLFAAGWNKVAESHILTEQSAYLIAPGRVQKVKTGKAKKADYVLEYRGRKLAIIEAKSDEKDVSEGVAQAKEYAEMMQIRFTYATNGDKIYFIDMGVCDTKGNYSIPSTEHEVEKFPSPQELWQMTYPTADEWRDKFNLCAFNRDGGRGPRYYQENAINNVLKAVANKQQRILLTMATGTGKTYTAFQICWKLFQTGWNKDIVRSEKLGVRSERKPRILFITDRNTLADQASNDFSNFDENAMTRINPKLLHSKKYDGKVPTAQNIYFTIFQTFMAKDETETPYYKQYPAEFFDFIIIDECHRGGAKDESEWRELLEYFKTAYQLGMTATPRRQENANTYNYFGDPVYSYSLKQGIEDGYLVPYRIGIAESNIDEYKYDPEDDVEGEIDEEKVYTEKDFYNGNIKIRERDEHRVKELLGKIEPDEKTLVFCSTQQHAAIIRDMINQHKRSPYPNYCKRVTAEDLQEGEKWLKLFQDNDRQIPTVLTTSQKLSTGVDARNVRNIVLLRPINSMIEFKQIIGRGTRLFDEKYYFTIYDFVGASEKFNDPEWDGDPICPKCGNWPCTCSNGGGNGGGGGKEPKPCKVCGNLPCTCPGGGGIPKKTIVVKLGKNRALSLYTEWSEKVQFGDELLTVDELVKRLFGEFPKFFSSKEDLQEQWSHPNTRQALLDQLEQEGFSEDKLEMIRTVLKYEKCDLLDVMEYLAYNTTPMERERRVLLVKQQIAATHSKEQQLFVSFILDYYQRQGFKELASDNLTKFITLKYHSTQDGLRMLGMTGKEVRELYLNMQKMLYTSQSLASQSFSDAPVKNYDYSIKPSSMRMVADETKMK